MAKGKVKVSRAASPTMNQSVRIEKAVNGFVVNFSKDSGKRYINKTYVARNKLEAKSIASKLL